MKHKFKVGDIVTVASSASRHIPRGDYEIVRHLPTEPDGPKYQVKSIGDGHQRTIPEADLVPVGTA